MTAKKSEPTPHPSAGQIRAYAHHVGDQDSEMEQHLRECDACEALFVAEVLGLPKADLDRRTLDEILKSRQ